MKERKSFWKEAGTPGLVLGGIAAAYMFLTAEFPSTALNSIGWFVKLVGCIWLMRLYIRNFVRSTDGCTRQDAYRFGVEIAVLSSIVYSGFFLLYTTVISPDYFNDTVVQVMEQYKPLLDSNSAAAMDAILPKLPSMVFFTNLIYCIIYGSVLSAILAGRSVAGSPFTKKKEDDDDII